MNTYDLARGLHILAVIAWMAGLLFLPRLYAYDAEQNAKPEPLKGEMQGLLRLWQTRLLRIILTPAMILAWVFGLWLIHIDVSARGAAFLAEPWMVAKLAGVPPAVVVRAREVLDRLEREAGAPAHLEDLPLFAAHAAEPEAPAFGPSEVEAQLKTLDLDGMSPREAMAALYRLKELMR